MVKKTEKREYYGFTSKELDEETGLYYFGARYYEPQISRWMSADPIYDGVKEGFGVYTYCRNNPLIYKDPTGLESADAAYSRNKVIEENRIKARKATQDSVNRALGKTKQNKDPIKTKTNDSVKRYLNDSGRLDYSAKDVAEAMQDATKEYKKQTGFDLFAGDFSNEGGVPSDRHKSSDGKIYDHKGFSVDLKFGTDDGSSGAGKSYDSEGSNYSATNTVKMLSIIKSCAEHHSLTLKYVIFGDSTVYNDESLKGTRFLTTESLLSIHKNHIHVEFRPKPAKK